MRRLVLSCILPFHSRLLAPVASPVALPMAATRSFSASNTLSESLLSIESAGTSSAAPSDGLKPSLVVLVGCTGSGKSKLGVELAQQFNGEVISVDSMQVYRGLEIATAAVTPEEAKGVPHHFVGCNHPWEPFDIIQFKSAAVPLIYDLQSRGKLPILVGGTFYWLESLLWPSFIGYRVPRCMEKEDLQGHSPEQQELWDKSASVVRDLSPFEAFRVAQNDQAEQAQPAGEAPMHVWDVLRYVDPAMAHRLHRNDLRKVNRSLQVLLETGRPHSEWLRETGELRGKQLDSVPNPDDALPYRVLIVFLDVAKVEMERRLGCRVDQMSKAGLIKEVETLYDRLQEHDHGPGSPLPLSLTTHGVHQALGFKEFSEYLRLRWNTRQHPPPAQELVKRSRQLDKERKAAVELVKQRTFTYARSQLKWIRKRILAQTDFPVLQVDSSVPAKWQERVFGPVTEACQAFLSEPKSQLDLARFQKYLVDVEPVEIGKPRQAAALDTWTKFFCEWCEMELNGSVAYKAHMNSSRHRSRVNRARQRQQREQAGYGSAREGRQERQKRQKLAPSADPEADNKEKCEEDPAAESQQ